MMEKLCREYGLYLVMLIGVLSIQAVFSYGLLETPGEPGLHARHEKSEERLHLFEKLAMPSCRVNMPLALLGVLFAIVALFGLGLLADVIFLMKWFSGRSTPTPKVLGPWKIEDLFKLFVLFFFTASCLHAGFYVLSTGQWIQERILKNISLLAGTMGLYLIILLTLIAWRRHKYPGNPLFGILSWGKTAKALGTGLWAYIAFVPPLMVLMLVSLLICQGLGIPPQPHDIVAVLAREKSLWRLAYLGILTMLAGPIVEEIVFRGVTYSALRKRLGVFAAAAGSSMIFSLAHANVVQTLPVFGMGVILALLYETTGSLIASVSFHVINNTLAFALTLLVLSWAR